MWKLQLCYWITGLRSITRTKSVLSSPIFCTDDSLEQNGESALLLACVQRNCRPGGHDVSRSDKELNSVQSEMLCRHVELVTLLLDRGADINLETKASPQLLQSWSFHSPSQSGKSPYTTALKLKHFHCWRLMVLRHLLPTSLSSQHFTRYRRHLLSLSLNQQPSPSLPSAQQKVLDCSDLLQFVTEYL
jgi:hypothetical protein